MRSETDRRFLIAVWHSIHAIRWACVLVACVFAGGLLCVVPAEGQAVRDEGFPAKGVFPEEYPDVPGAEEACGPFEVPGAFGEGCVEDSGPDAFGGVSQGAGFSSDPSNPVFRTAPRLECPAAVFVEELETGVIDCHAYDEAGEEHLEYYWEPLEGAPHGYLDAPRLTGEDRPNPSIVAPSSPFYATLESFASEDATLRYRYRLTATSRVTGLSSRAEVEVFVLLRRPIVYCPLEYEASAGSEIVLSCEGADPLSFRMDYEAGSEASWEWEGLWGSSASLLSASDTPSPLFRAPLGGAGETHHYIASMTTTSSGVPRTARRRVSVRVVEGEAAGAAAEGSLSAEASPPKITCPDYEVYPTANDFRLKCTVRNEPPGATYSWMERGGTPNTNKLKRKSRLQPTFSMWGYSHYTDIKKKDVYKYKVTLSAPGITPVTAPIKVTVLDHPDLMTCATLKYEVYAGDPDFPFDCEVNNSNDPNLSGPKWYWIAGPSSGTKQYATFRRAERSLKEVQGKYHFKVPDSLPAGMETEYFQYEGCFYATKDDPHIGKYDLIESEYITVKVKKKPEVAVTCEDPDSVYEGAADVALSCEAKGAHPGFSYSYAWTARGSTPDADLLSATNISSPKFDVPDTVDKDETYEYTLTVSAANAKDGLAEVAVKVKNKVPLDVACVDNPYSALEGEADITLACLVTGPPDGSDYAYAWTARGSTPDVSLLSASDVAWPTFDVPDTVDKDETYEYTLTVSAANAEDGEADVTVMVLDRGASPPPAPVALALSCEQPPSVYEGSEDIALSCEAMGAPDGSDYAWAWEALGATPAGMLSATDVSSPKFDVPDEVDETTRYEYRVTATAPGAEDGTADVTVTVLDSPPPAPVALALSCEQPPSVYEGSADIELSCEATGDPDGSDYAFAWETRGATANTDLLSATDVPSPTFYVPDEVDETTRYEYKLMATAENAFGVSADVTVTVLDSPPPAPVALALSCEQPPSIYEGSEDIALSCEPAGAPDGSAYAWAWEALGGTPAGMLSAADGPTPTFYVPEEVAADETYEYRVTATAENAEPAEAEVTVTVLNRGALALTCANPAPVYEGSEDIALNCEATGAPDGSDYAYAWAAVGSTPAGMLSALDMASPTFYVPDEVAADETYEYRVTVSAENAEAAAAEVAVTVLNKVSLDLACADPDPVYEGSEDITLNCSATGAPDGSVYAYVWEALGATPVGMLSALDASSPTFYVPQAVDADETYAYRITVTAENAEAAAAEVTVTILNRDDPPLPPPALAALALTCANPAPVYEGSADIALSCEASGAPDGSVYSFAWAARGATANTDLLSATDISSPTFYVPDAVDETTRYEYGVTVSADNAEPATANVTVTVLDRPEAPAPPPAVAFSGDPTSLGVATSVSSLRFGAQPSGAQIALDPLTDRLSTSASGPYHAGRMTLSPDGSLAFAANGELALSIELVAPVALRHEAGAATLALIPRWSIAASCEQLASEAIGGLHTQTTLSESDCRLLLLGGELDLAGAAPGRYAGNIDVILRTGAGEETHSVEAEVTVVAAPRVITIGPGGVRFDASREVPSALTEEQNLSVYPDMAFMTRDEPSGAFELSNPSLTPLEVSVSARFGYAEATEDGREIVVEDVSASRFGDLSEIVNIYPTTLTLMPGERGVVRYGVQEEALASLEEAGYAAFFEVMSSPRRYAQANRLPEGVVASDETARVTLRVPGAYVPGEIAPRLNAELLSLSGGASPAATFLLETDGVPFAGEAAAYDGEGRELGRSETLTYARSRVRMSLDRLPEGETVFLRFTPRGSGAAPEPVSVPWRAPRREGRDIGAAQDRERATRQEGTLQ